jgi:hypothetical protein
MSRAAKTTDNGRIPFRRLSDSEILLFLTRTLQPDSAGTEPSDIFAKLRELKDILDRQESALLEWAAAPGKDRLCEALATAKDLVTQIADDLAGAVRRESVARGAAPADATASACR